MKKVLGVFGLVGACALCCSIPVATSMLGAALLSGTGFTLGWDVALGGAALAAAIGAAIRRARRARAAECSCPPMSCGSAVTKGL